MNLTGKHEGNLSVSSDLVIRGMVTGTVTVVDNAHLELNGTVVKDVVVTEGTSVHIHGMVLGSVINDGGMLYIAGTVGAVQRNAGSTEIAPQALVRNSV
uniref:Polymer-forming cytoskeletal protein n=1 Tax=viral metagenome TaxID=1070528 RepID=A0A6H1ZEF7_9ZZZZ